MIFPMVDFLVDFFKIDFLVNIFKSFQLTILIFFVQVIMDDLGIVYELVGYDGSSTGRKSREPSIEKQLYESRERIKWLNFENANLKKKHITYPEEKDDQIQKEKEETIKIMKELQEKLYKIGQSEQTIFFEQTKNVKRILFKGWTMF